MLKYLWVLLVVLFSCNDYKKLIIGKWLLVKTESVDGKTVRMYDSQESEIIEFKEDLSYYNGIDAEGSLHTYRIDSNSFTLGYINYIIEKLDSKELIIRKDSSTHVFGNVGERWFYKRIE